MPAEWYPKATRQDYSAAYPGASQSKVGVIVLHSTETTGKAGYGGGASAPHLEYHPPTRTWRQFFPLTMTSRALANLPGGVETNRHPAGLVQVELCGTSGWAKAKGITPIWPEVTDLDILGDIAHFLRWMHDEWGVPLATPVTPWPAWNDYRFQRLTSKQWNALRGIAGHSMVPENDHTDPGALNIQAVLTLARGAGKDDMPLTKADAQLVATAVLEAYTTTRGQTLLAQAAQRSLSDWSKVPAMLAAISAKLGAPLNEKALAAAVVAGMADQVRDAVRDAVQIGGTADTVADRVIARLGEALTTDTKGDR